MPKLNKFAKWHKKYLPKEAYDPNVTKTWKSALKHCLRKWEGCLPEILEEYNIEVPNNELYDKKKRNDLQKYKVHMGSANCALCWKAQEVARRLKTFHMCDCCLFQKHFGACCAYGETKAWSVSPWNSWSMSKDPKPMIKALKELSKIDWDNKAKGAGR